MDSPHVLARPVDCNCFDFDFQAEINDKFNNRHSWKEYSVSRAEQLFAEGQEIVVLGTKDSSKVCPRNDARLFYPTNRINSESQIFPIVICATFYK